MEELFPDGCTVALLAEGVDRNIINVDELHTTPEVALLAEGVDRNFCRTDGSAMIHTVALLAEGVDRNKVMGYEIQRPGESPSSRRAWIEILHPP